MASYIYKEQQQKQANMHAHKNYLSSPGEHDGNEPEILASILDELILELHDAQKKKTTHWNNKKVQH